MQELFDIALRLWQLSNSSASGVHSILVEIPRNSITQIDARQIGLPCREGLCFFPVEKMLQGEFCWYAAILDDTRSDVIARIEEWESIVEKWRAFSLSR